MAETESPPSLIASHIDVVYRVYGAKRVGTVSGTPTGSRIGRLLRAKSPHVGAVREVHAVKDVSFVSHHGESIGIIGRNGSGKSTLLRALAGLIPPTNGEVYLGGRASLLGVNAALMRDLSGARNIMIGGQALGLTPKEVHERMDEIVEFAGLEEFIDLPMKAYSSGMAARLRFAISTAAIPNILMIDEALATGDAEFKARSQQRIEEIRKSAGTVFLVSHSDATVRSVCDRALWLEGGELVMDGPVNEVCDAYQASRKRPAARKRTAARKSPTPKPKPKPVPKASKKPPAAGNASAGGNASGGEVEPGPAAEGSPSAKDGTGAAPGTVAPPDERPGASA